MPGVSLRKKKETVIPNYSLPIQNVPSKVKKISIHSELTERVNEVVSLDFFSACSKSFHFLFMEILNIKEAID